MIRRKLTDQLVNSLRKMPAVALLGPRQVGKTTLALEISKNHLNKPGFHRACKEIGATRRFVVYSGKERFPMAENTEAIGIAEFIDLLSKHT